MVSIIDPVGITDNINVANIDIPRSLIKSDYLFIAHGLVVFRLDGVKFSLFFVQLSLCIVQILHGTRQSRFLHSQIGLTITN
jgi:hypothetical protein